MLKVVIVEDELHSRETLRNLLNEYCKDVEIAAMAGSVSEGIDSVQEHQPDLVFLDIELNSELGFDLLDKVQSRDFEVIFTTAYEHYALKAIKFSAIDYLLKPIDFEELQLAVCKVSKRKEAGIQNLKLLNLLGNFRQGSGNRKMITLAASEGLEFIRVPEIIRCEASGSYTNFFLKDGRNIMVSRHLKEYENLLTEYNFFRVHQSHLVNMSEVKKFVRVDGGHIVMNDDSIVYVSQRKKDDFIKAMKGR